MNIRAFVLLFYILLFYYFIVGFELNIVPFINIYILIQNITIKSIVPPANANANNTPNANNGIPIYCRINGISVR